MMGYGAGLGFGMGGWLVMFGGILVMIGIVVLIAWAIGQAGQGGSVAQGQGGRPAGDDALEILRARFARGEITADEYLAARQTLEAGR